METTPETADDLIKFWQDNRVPPEGTVSKLPKGVKNKDARPESCSECGGYHKPAAVHLDYMGHADVREALLKADIFWNWTPMATDECGLPKVYTRNGQMVLWINLTVLGVTRPGVGTAPAGKEEVDKELIGDAIRNAALSFGVAVTLWSKADRATQTDERTNVTHQGSGGGQQRQQQRAQEEDGDKAPDPGASGLDVDAIRALSNGQVTDALKLRKLPLDGTDKERRNRLWAHDNKPQGDSLGGDPPADPQAAADGGAAQEDPPAGDYPPADVIMGLVGRELDPLLTKAGVSKAGTVKERRQRLVDHLYGAPADPPADPPAASQNEDPDDAEGEGESYTPKEYEDAFPDAADAATIQTLKDELAKLTGAPVRAYMAFKKGQGYPDPDGMTMGQAYACLDFIDRAQKPAEAK